MPHPEQQPKYPVEVRDFLSCLEKLNLELDSLPDIRMTVRTTQEVLERGILPIVDSSLIYGAHPAISFSINPVLIQEQIIAYPAIFINPAGWLSNNKIEKEADLVRTASMVFEYYSGRYFDRLQNVHQRAMDQEASWLEQYAYSSNIRHDPRIYEDRQADYAYYMSYTYNLDFGLSDLEETPMEGFFDRWNDDQFKKYLVFNQARAIAILEADVQANKYLGSDYAKDVDSQTLRQLSIDQMAVMFGILKTHE